MLSSDHHNGVTVRRTGISERSQSSFTLLSKTPSISPLRTSFDLVALGIKDFLLIRVAAIGWGVILRWIWRARLLERFLLVDRKYMYLLHPCEDKTQA